MIIKMIIMIIDCHLYCITLFKMSASVLELCCLIILRVLEDFYDASIKLTSDLCGYKMTLLHHLVLSVLPFSSINVEFCLGVIRV